MFYVLLFILLILLFMLLCFRKAYYSSPRRKEDPRHVSSSEQYQQFKDQILALVDNISSYPYEQVYIKSDDGLELAGKYYQIRKGAPVIIMFHGYRSTAYRDSSGVFKLAMELGYNMLIPDMRAHGLSQGRVITLGIKERYDCLRWVEYISHRLGEDTPILLAGCSMGAATIMMSADLLPAQVKGLICDCGYSSVKGIMESVSSRLHLLPRLTYFFLRLSAILFGHFDPESCSSVSSLSKSSLPILIVHGEDDNFVPCSMAYENYEASAAEIKMLLTVPGAGHGLSILVDEEKYRATLHSFLEKIGLM